MQKADQNISRLLRSLLMYWSKSTKSTSFNSNILLAPFLLKCRGKSTYITWSHRSLASTSTPVQPRSSRGARYATRDKSNIIDNFSVQPPTMAETISEPFFKGSTGRSSRGLLRLIILCLIAAAYVSQSRTGSWQLLLLQFRLIDGMTLGRKKLY